MQNILINSSMFNVSIRVGVEKALGPKDKSFICLSKTVLVIFQKSNFLNSTNIESWWCISKHISNPGLAMWYPRTLIITSKKPNFFFFLKNFLSKSLCEKNFLLHFRTSRPKVGKQDFFFLWKIFCPIPTPRKVT